MRWITGLLALVTLASAQGKAEKKKKKPELFPANYFRNSVEGARERVYERYLRMLERTRKSPADIEALEALVELDARFNREISWKDKVRAALQAKGLDEKQRGALRGLLGYLLATEADGMGSGNVIIIINGRVQRDGGKLPREARALYTEAEGHLREAIRTNPHDMRSKYVLSDLLGTLYKDDEGKGAEAKKLREQADALALQDVPEPVDARAVRHDVEAAKVRAQAEELEQKKANPDHGEALVMRRRALMLDYCTNTIPFTYDATLYQPASLIVPQSFITRNLTRSYTKRDGEVDYVRPQYFAPTSDKRLALIARLAENKGDNAAALLLALLCRANNKGPTEDAALDALTIGRHPALAKTLPTLLAAALLGQDRDRYSPWARRLLIQVAVRLNVKDAAPVLRRALAEDTDLYVPLGVAAALGALGTPADADALLVIARDPKRDVSFRREAILALGRAARDRLADAPKEEHLELAVAAAKYAHTPSEDLKGALLNGLARVDEADDAARYCAQLGIREAVPLIEDRLTKAPEHYTADALKRSLAVLTGRG